MVERGTPCGRRRAREEAGGRGGAAQVGQQADAWRRSPRAARLQALRPSGLSRVGLVPALRRGRCRSGSRRGRAAALLDQREQCAPGGRKERGVGEGAHRPGRRRVQLRAPDLPHQSPLRQKLPHPPNRRFFPYKRFCGARRSEGVGEVVAGGFLLVVGAVLPVEGRDPAGIPGRAGGGGGPAGGVALSVAAADRLPGAVEARRGAEVEAEQEARRRGAPQRGSRRRRGRWRRRPRRAARRRPSRPSPRRRPRRCGGRSEPA